jgi:hypothetical protein
MGICVWSMCMWMWMCVYVYVYVYVQVSKDDKMLPLDTAVSQEHARIEMDKESGTIRPPI